MDHELLTIVIPTKDRASFLKRALTYYCSVNCRFPIVIGDSSSGENIGETEKLINSLGQKLNILHIAEKRAGASSAAGGWQKDEFLKGLIDHVKTPYVAFYADDDFAVANNLDEAVKFLEANKDYSFVCGQAIMFDIGGNIYGRVGGANIYGQRAIEDKTPRKRLFNLFSDYVVLEYGISRTEQKKYRWNRVFESGADNLTGEIINCALVAIQGKVKISQKLYLVRQGHKAQTSIKSGDHFDQIMNRLFVDNYKKANMAISKELDLIGDKEAHETPEDFVKKCFWLYFEKGMNGSWRQQYEPDRMPALFKFFARIKNRLIRMLVLRYYRDFKRVRSIVEGRS